MGCPWLSQSARFWQSPRPTGWESHLHWQKKQVAPAASLVQPHCHGPSLVPGGYRESQRWWVIFRMKATEFYRVDMSLTLTSCYRVQRAQALGQGLWLQQHKGRYGGMWGCVYMWWWQTCMWGVVSRLLSSSPSFCELLCIMTSTCEDRFNNHQSGHHINTTQLLHVSCVKVLFTAMLLKA